MPHNALLEELEERALDIEDAAAECRLLRHAWPRKRDANYRTMVSTTVLAKNRAGQPTRIERVMACAGGCGVKKTVEIAIDPKAGTMSIVDSDYDYSGTNGGYLLKNKDKDGNRYDEPIDRETLGFVLLARLHPDLAW